MSGIHEAWSRLTESWDALADPRAHGLTSTKKWNAVADLIAVLENEIFSNPDGVVFIIEKIKDPATSEERREQILTMFDLQHSPVHEAKKFRADPRINLSAEQLPLTPYLPLTAVPNVPDEGTPPWRSDEQLRQSNHMLSRFGGYPTAGDGFSWPQAREGGTYTFIAQVDLSMVRQDIPAARKMALPPDGVLQLFVELGTLNSLGHEVDAVFRFIPEEDLAPFPDETGVALMEIIPCDVGISASTGPIPEGLDSAARERFLFARSLITAVAADPSLRGVTYPGAEPFLPLSGMGGYGNHNVSHETPVDIDITLPLGSDDTHTLALELVGPRDFRGTPLETLDLQVWVRSSEFATGKWSKSVTLVLPKSQGHLGVTEATHA